MDSLDKKPLAPLSAAAEALLPDSEQKIRCSVFTSELDVNPAGTAITAACVILIDTPLPWPKPVFQHDYLAGVANKGVDRSGQPVRVLATVPRFGRESSAYAFRRTAEGTVAARLPLAGRSAADVVDTLVSVDDPTTLDGAEPLDPRAVLVCTQGSHDVCCGSEGTRLADQVLSDYRLAGITLFRVSHTGGHRFAPTAMTFPDGRMWAYATVDDLSMVFSHAGSPRDLAARCRGSWEAPTPRCQAAEVAAWAGGGWDLGPAEFEDDDDVVRVIRDGGSVDVRVTISRDIPVIRCRAEGGLPAKPSVEFAAQVL
ncbi:MAG: hypothetical protein HKN24_07315 [Acidimicrobiales bacterium]|nr:hypothetical protein [Acidimicrobiales bacterium]